MRCHHFLYVTFCYISQIHHISRSKHKFDVKLEITVRKNVFSLKELENWVGNPKISREVKMYYIPSCFSLVSTVIIPFSIFGVFYVLKTWIQVGFYLKFQ
jgi:hypothetical protein